MKFRCPYCKQTHGPEPHATCPHCGKTMRVPGPLKPPKKRKKTHTRSSRVGELPASVIGSTGTFGRKPATLAMVILLLFMVGIMLVGRAGRAFKPKKRVPMETRALKDLNTLREAIEIFHSDCNRYPRQDKGLDALINTPGHWAWDGPYVNMIRSDPWHTPYIYRAGTNGFALFCAGPDRKPDTTDDIYPSAPPEPLVSPR